MTLLDMKRSKTSAGLLMFRKTGDDLEVLLVHPGGPYFQNKDEGAWTIPFLDRLVESLGSGGAGEEV